MRYAIPALALLAIFAAICCLSATPPPQSTLAVDPPPQYTLDAIPDLTRGGCDCAACGCIVCQCGAFGSCVCPLCDVAKISALRPLTYSEGYWKAVEEGRPLVTFIGCPVRDVPGAVVCSAAALQGFQPPQVSVSAPDGKELFPVSRHGPEEAITLPTKKFMKNCGSGKCEPAYFPEQTAAATQAAPCPTCPQTRRGR